MCSKERVSKKRERLDLHNDATASLSESVGRGEGLQIIADLLPYTLIRGRDYAHHITTSPSKFLELPRDLCLAHVALKAKTTAKSSKVS